MDSQTLILLIITGLLAGIISGGMGVGGGIIIVPALVFLFGFTQHDAQGTSLSVLLFPVVFLGVANYYRKGFVNVRFAIVLIVAFFIGSYIGSLISVNLPDKTLKRVFGVLMIVAGAKMIVGK